MVKNNYYKVILFIFAFIAGFALFYKIPNKNAAIIAYNDYKDGTTPYNEISNLKKQYQNDDIVGTLEIPNTNFKTVFVQSYDNNYYLRKGLDKRYERGGTPFLDYRVNIEKDKKLLIYGHNSKYVDMPFKALQQYDNEDFYNNHKFIVINTLNETKKYEIFSVYVAIDNWDYTNLSFKSNKEYLKHLNILKNRSIYKTNTELNEDDEILILQTCSTNKKYSNYKKKFLLIISKRVS